MSKIILKKNGTDYPLLTMPNHYPADRVYLDGDTTKNVQDAVDKSQAMIATVQPNLTAIKAYAKGEQFVYNGLLYKVTTAINSGGTITIGGNCELADSVTEQIRDILTEYIIGVSVTIASGTSVASKDDLPISCNVPSGYTPLAVREDSYMHNNGMIGGASTSSNNKTSCRWYNMSSVSVALGGHTVVFYFIKNGFNMS